MNIESSPTQTKLIAKDNLQLLTFFTLLSVAVFLPSVIHQQAITGPIINAALLLASVLLGPSTALMIGLMPSVAALSRGLLPLPLAPVVPFIMLSNGIYIYLFSKLKNTNFAGAVVTAAAAKFGWLYFVSQFLLANLLPAKFMIPAANMMSWPQLATALAGGVIAWLIIQSLNLSNKNQ